MVKKEDLKSVLGEVVGDKISKAITPVETKIDNIGTKLNTVAEDVAFLKGKEEVRREISTK